MSREPTDRDLELARRHPAVYATLASEGAWLLAPHLRLLADKVMDLVEGRIRRLVVSMPPRSGKTLFLSRYLPSWWLGTRERDRVILCSYQERLTRKNSRAARDDLAHWGPRLWGVGASSRASTAEWDVYRDGRRTGGGLTAVGTGGALTGRGADLLVCDDLVKGVRETGSAASREHAWEWFQAEALSRLEPGGRAIVCMTRWSVDDLVGRLLDRQARGEGGEPWAIVNLPALAEADDPLGRAPGEALWPKRFPVSELEKLRKDVGPVVWQALYQGSPQPIEGGLFKREWFNYYDLEGEVARVPGQPARPVSELRRFITADLAVSTKDSADYSVFAVWGFEVQTRLLLLLHVSRVRLEGPDLIKHLRSLIESRRVVAAYVEKVAWQLHFIQQAQREGLPIREIEPDRDKVSRALPVTAALEGKRLLLPRGAPWLPELEAELLTFPGGKHDDQVDAIGYGVLVGNSFRVIQATTRSPSDREERRGGGWVIGRGD